MLAHLIAYPIGFIAAIASMPIGIIARKDALLSASDAGASSGIVADVARQMKLDGAEALQLELLLEFVMYVTLGVLLLVHLAALPWAIGAARAAKGAPDLALKRGYRLFVVLTAATLVIIALTGTGGWIWLFTL
jgi:hypothetical protein